MKTLTPKQLKEIGDKIPLGSTYDANGNELTFKNSNGYWEERTYDANGNELTFKDSSGYCYERTYDANGNELTYKTSNGYWYERTYDAKGNELTSKDSSGVNRIALARDPEYTLWYDLDSEHYIAGCRNFANAKDALKHWKRKDKRAVIFTKAIEKHMRAIDE